MSGTWKDVKLNWQKQSIHYRSGVHLKKLLYRSNKNYERVLHSPMFLSKSVSLDITIIAYQQNMFWILTQIKIFFFSLWVNIHEPCTDIDDRFFLKFIRVSILWFTNFYLPRIQRSAICCKNEKNFSDRDFKLLYSIHLMIYWCCRADATLKTDNEYAILNSHLQLQILASLM